MLEWAKLPGWYFAIGYSVRQAFAGASWGLRIQPDPTLVRG
jgi:hypothetical protein